MTRHKYWIAANGLGDEFNYGGKPSTPPGSVTIPLEPEDGRWLGPATGLLSGIYTSRGFEAYYYDTDGNRIESYGTGYNIGRKKSFYNYTGAVTREKYTYPSGFALPSMEKNYTYTETGQPLTMTVTVNPWVTGTPVVTPGLTVGDAVAATSDIGTVLPVPTAKISRRYDRLGRVSGICLGDHATVDYEYDVHGWLTSQTLTCADTVMTMTLVYAGSSKPRYNGFISRKDWNGRSYLYEYDGKGRLTKAGYTASVNAAEGEDFSASYSYDSRGNITTLKRKGVTDRTGGMETFGSTDNMYMDYNGNRMSRVEHILDTPLWPPFVGNLQDEPISVEVDDGGGSISITLPEDFSYNDAGDLTRDETRKIASIKRTTEGRPSEVRFSDGHIQRTVWDMAGNKLSTKYLVEADAIALGEGLSPAEDAATDPLSGTLPVDTSSIVPVDPMPPVIHLYTREYTGDGHVIKAKTSYTWSGTDTTRVIESIQFDGGYFDSGSGANYYVKDYLGNIIAVVDQGGHLVQATDYYPYGLPFRMEDMANANDTANNTADTGTGSTSNRYLFGGKEFLTEDGLNEYYQEARQYIPRIPRFDRLDDKIDDHRDYTPYLAFAGNPIMCADPDGCDTIFAVKRNGSVYPINTTDKDDPNKYIVKGKTKRKLKNAKSPGPMENGPEVAVMVSGLAEHIKDDVKRSEELQIETGGHMINGEHSQWIDGEKYDNKSGKQSIRPFKIAGATGGRVDEMNGYYHIHPVVDGYPGTGRAKPSGPDKDWDVECREFGYNGMTVVIGIKDQKATIYYKNKTIAKIKLEDFYRLNK